MLALAILTIPTLLLMYVYSTATFNEGTSFKKEVSAQSGLTVSGDNLTVGSFTVDPSTGNIATSGTFTSATSTLATTTIAQLTVTNDLLVSGNATTSGYLVIGTTNPSIDMSAGDLLIGGSATSTGDLTVQGTLYSGPNTIVGSGSSLSLTSQGDIKMKLGDAAGLYELQVLDANDSQVFRIDSDGNATTTGWLNIGATVPTNEMSAGDLYVGGNATTTGSFTVGTNYLFVDKDSGNVGIGTTGPGAGEVGYFSFN
jgi:hypothetical protein